jgi:prophage tail gpP-like protein
MITVKINDRITTRKVDFFEKFSINFRLDSIASTFSFSGYFNHENREHVDLYCIGHYHEITLEYKSQLLLTGYILKESLKLRNTKQSISCAGYSLPGVFQNCQIPTALYPLQSDGLSLKEIAQKLICNKKFGLKMRIDPAVESVMNEVFEKATAKESQSIESFLVELAAQKNLIISHTPKGEVLFTRVKTRRKPILHYGDGGVPITDIEFSFDGENLHSDITIIKQADPYGGNSGEETIRNPYVPYVYRPKVIAQSSGTDVDTLEAAKNALSQELQSIKLSIVTDRWEVDGKVIMPGDEITVICPEVYLFNKSLWMVEEVELNGDSEATTAKLNCVMPEVYSGTMPEYMFHGINLH